MFSSQIVSPVVTFRRPTAAAISPRARAGSASAGARCSAGFARPSRACPENARISEALDLSWDDESRLLVELSYQRPMLRIPAEKEKGHKDRLLPIAPEFATFLRPRLRRLNPCRSSCQCVPPTRGWSAC